MSKDTSPVWAALQRIGATASLSLTAGAGVKTAAALHKRLEPLAKVHPLAPNLVAAAIGAVGTAAAIRGERSNLPAPAKAVCRAVGAAAATSAAMSGAGAVGQLALGSLDIAAARRVFTRPTKAPAGESYRNVTPPKA